MSEEVRHAFGARVRALRKERGISLRKFALSIGADKTFISNVENGKQSPTLDTIERIAAGLDVTMSFLMFDVDASRVTMSRDGLGTARTKELPQRGLPQTPRE